MLNLQQFIRRVSPLRLVLGLTPAIARGITLGAAAALTLLIMLLFSDSLSTLEERLGAQGWVMSADTTPEQALTIVAIDERSLAEVGPWPWSRENMARLVNGLNQAGVRLQVHDITYPEPKSGDAALISALESSPGVVLGQVPVLPSNGGRYGVSAAVAGEALGSNVKTGQMSHPVTGVSCAADGAASSFVANHAGLAGLPAGHIAPRVDGDGAVRRVPAVVCVNGQAYPTLAIAALLTLTQAENWQASIEPGNGWLAPEQAMHLASYPGLAIPLDANGDLRISYQAAPEAFQAVSAVDVINGDIPQGVLNNSLVLIGATAFGMGDIVPTPYSGSAPGVELQARLLSSLLNADMPYTPAGASALLTAFCLLAATGLLVLATSRREALTAYGLPAAAVLLPVAALLIHWQLLGQYNLWLGWMAPAVFSLMAATLLLLLEQGRVRAERTRVFGNLTSYLPSDVARDIAFSLPTSSINAQRCDVTLLSADLRNFSAFGEARPPEESAALLHYFFTRAAEIVAKHGGHIHEFKGDGLLAVWEGQSSAAANAAYQAAQEMQENIHKEMPQQPPAGLEPLALGIGLEQGPALRGSIGPAHRRTHTLLGDSVTITMRIQEMTAELAQPILLGECIARQLSDHQLESQGSYLLNGLRIPHVLFAPATDSAALRRARQDQLNLKVVSGGR
jgi:CHASE2 domain-containing sensor protein/class 3 adenylate cyclase